MGSSCSAGNRGHIPWSAMGARIFQATGLVSPPRFKRHAACFAVNSFLRHRHRSSAAGRASSLDVARRRSARSRTDPAGRANARDVATIALARTATRSPTAMAGGDCRYTPTRAVRLGDLAPDASRVRGSGHAATARRRHRNPLYSTQLANRRAATTHHAGTTTTAAAKNGRAASACHRSTRHRSIGASVEGCDDRAAA